MPSAVDLLNKKDLQVKVVVGVIVFILFAAFCIGQFVTFDNVLLFFPFH